MYNPYMEMHMSTYYLSLGVEVSTYNLNLQVKVLRT